MDYTSGGLNRLDRLTAANYGMPFNINLCENKTITIDSRPVMLQATSMYTKGDGSEWLPIEMFNILVEVAESSLNILGRDLFNQLTKKVLDKYEENKEQ